MHPLFNKADELSHPVIGTASEVHRVFGRAHLSRRPAGI